jgi:hypothetical protein
MIPPRIARLSASLHKWLSLIVGVQVVLWTVSGLFFTLFAIEEVRGDALWRKPASMPVNMAAVKLQMSEALASVAEDRPQSVQLKQLAGKPVYEIRAEIGVFLVSAEDGALITPIDEALASNIASAAWVAGGKPTHIHLLDKAPPESGARGAVWAASFPGKGNPVLYVNAIDGTVGPLRTDLWRTYDFLWSLHIMDYRDRESFHHPLIIAASVLALTMTLFGIVLLIHRFARLPKARNV